MVQLRYPWLWLSLGWVLVIAVCVGSLLPASLLMQVSFRISDKILHAGSYFVLMIWFAGLYRRRHHFLVAAVLLALGVGLDVAQGRTATRFFELRDIAANGIGILCGLVLSWSLLAGWCQRLERRLFPVEDFRS